LAFDAALAARTTARLSSRSTSSIADRVIRAMTASGIVPSAIEGRIRCARAERRADQSPALRVSTSMNPVAAGTSYSTAMRPETGVQPSCTEKNRISSNAHQKIGIE